MTNNELESIIASSLAQLHQVCAAAHPSEGADHLILVGGSARSPLVRRHIQEAFGGTPVTPVSEPRTAVANGAALQAAVLDGKIGETLLTDVTPFSLGIKATSNTGNHYFSRLVEADARIPLSRSEVFSTHQDQQTNVHVEVYNGHLHPESLIGQFNLDGIMPAPRGIPRGTRLETGKRHHTALVQRVRGPWTCRCEGNELRRTRSNTWLILANVMPACASRLRAGRLPASAGDRCTRILRSLTTAMA